MRVIAGTKKGVKLASVKGQGIRPTTDCTKELIFNTLRRLIKDSLVLDIYAGTGSLGIEALSRGATKAIFVENNKYALKILKKNLEKIGFMDRAEVLKVSAERALSKLHDLELKFDLIFADPPYGIDLASKTLTRIEENNILRAGGWFVVEHRLKEHLLNSIGSLNLTSIKRQGDTAISFYQHVQRK